jgi:hypothetical protein
VSSCRSGDQCRVIDAPASAVSNELHTAIAVLKLDPQVLISQAAAGSD